MLPTRYEILKNVENHNLKTIPLPEKPHQVWTLIDEELFLKIGLKHNRSAFMEDRSHDWDWLNGQFRFYGHSGRKGELHDLVIVYEV